MADEAGIGALRGSTRLAAVIGSPLRHSRSPALINAAFGAAGLDWAYVALEDAPGDAVAAVDAMRVLGLGGLSVTMPHKHAVIPALDRLSPAAEALEAVNCIAWDGDQLVGHNTDGDGLLDALAAEGVTPSGLRCVVLGAGGAARSVARSLGASGAAEVCVVNRTVERAVPAAALAGPTGRVGTPDDIRDGELIINATSVGMGASPTDAGPLPLDRDALRAGQIVVDLVYLPVETPLLRAAASAGARPIDGIGMLVHQAARAIRCWTGVDPDTNVMASAARS